MFAQCTYVQYILIHFRSVTVCVRACARLLIFFYSIAMHTQLSSARTNFRSTTSRLMYEITTRLLSMRWYVEFAELLQLLSLECWPSYGKYWRETEWKKQNEWIREREWKKNHVVNWNENESFVWCYPETKSRKRNWDFRVCGIVSEKKAFHFTVHTLDFQWILCACTCKPFSIFFPVPLQFFTHIHTSEHAHGKKFTIFSPSFRSRFVVYSMR